MSRLIGVVVCIWQDRFSHDVAHMQDERKQTASKQNTLFSSYLFEPHHEKNCFSHVNNKGADQPAHPCSLISTFVVRYLDSIIPILAIA